MKITFRKLQFIRLLQGSYLTFNGDIELDMTELPDGIQSITVNNGDFDGKQLITLPNDITINADKHVWLYSLTTMGNNVTIEASEVIFFKLIDTDLTTITLTDDGAVPNKVKQFLIDKKITVQCPETSQLLNLAFEGVKMEIIT